MGLIAGVGTLIVLWAGGKAVVEGRLTLGALAAFNGYLAYLTWPTIALGWTLSIVRRGLTSMARINEIDVRPRRTIDSVQPSAIVGHVRYRSEEHTSESSHLVISYA